MRVLLFRFCPELPPEQTLFYTALYTDEESPRNRRARAPERSNTDTRTLGTRAFFIFSKEEEKIKKGFWTLERGQLGNQARFFERTTMEGAAGASLSRAPSASFRSTVAPEKTVRVLREVDDIQSWRNGGVAKADVGKSGLLQFTATASSHCPGSAPFNLVDANDARIGYNASGAFGARRMKDRAAREGTKTEGWVTAARSDAWLLIELTRKSVVNEIILLNHATSRLTVSIALRARESAFVDIRTDILLAHKKESRIACGSLPCKYIKLRCHRGAPISIASIKFLGLPVGNANAKGDQFDKLRARSAQQVRVALPALPSLSLARSSTRARAWVSLFRTRALTQMPPHTPPALPFARCCFSFGGTRALAAHGGRHLRPVASSDARDLPLAALRPFLPSLPGAHCARRRGGRRRRRRRRRAARL